MPDETWISVAAYPDRMCAEAVIGLLTGAQVPCYIASDAYLPGLGTHFSVCVPGRLQHRAHWILEDSRVSEPELVALALKEAPGAGSDL